MGEKKKADTEAPPKQSAPSKQQAGDQKVYRTDLGESVTQAPPQTATDNEEQ